MSAEVAIEHPLGPASSTDDAIRRIWNVLEPARVVV
jgi:hypothetical protein